MQGGIGFIILGGLFVGSLLMSLWNIINTDWKQQKFNVSNLFKIFKLPLISLILLILFIVYALPYLDQ